VKRTASGQSGSGQRVRMISPPSSWAGWALFFLHGLTVACLVLALTPLGQEDTPAGRVVLLLDVSRSVCSDVRSAFSRAGDSLEPLLKPLEADTRVWIVPYGRRPVVWKGPASPAEMIDLLRHGEGPPTGNRLNVWETRLDLALQHAGALLSGRSGGTILVVGDGRGMGEEDFRAARLLSQQGHRVFSLPTPLGPRPMDDLFLREVEAPVRVRPGEPVHLRVRVGGTGSTPQPFSVVVREDGVERGAISRKGIWPGKGESMVAFRLDGGLAHRVRTFSIALEEEETRPGHGTTPADNARVSVVLGDPVRVLWVGGSATLPRAFQSLGPGYSVKKGSLLQADLAEADVTVLDNVPYGGRLLDAAGTKVLSRAVSRGRGLLAIGGLDSFGPGGWGGTEMERLLPVHLDRQGPPLDAVLLLDRSGSMAEGDRWNRTLFGAAAYLGGLRSGDRIRVVTFAAGVQDALGWQTVHPKDPRYRLDLQKTVVQTLARIQPHGPTNLVQAVRSVARGIKTLDPVPGSKRSRRLVILSDGQLGEAVEVFTDLGVELQALGIEPCVVATGASLEVDSRHRLEALTRMGMNGRLVVVGEKEDIGSAFRSAGNPEWWVPGPLAVSPSGNPPPRGLEVPAAFPDIGLLVRTRPREEGCNVIAVSPDSVPVLAVGRFGEGRVAAFPGALNRSGGDGWNRPGCWQPLLRWLANREEARPGRPVGRARISRDRLQVTVQVPAGSPLTGWSLKIGKWRFPLEPQGPGLVEAKVGLVSISESFGEVEFEAHSCAVLPIQTSPGEELKAVGLQVQALLALAEEGNGRLLALEGGKVPWPPDFGAEGGGDPDFLWPLLSLVFFFIGRGVKSMWIRGR